MAAGEITAIGSATVNGVRYETPADTVFNKEPDDSRNISDLTEGMVVFISGSLSSATQGTANALTFRDLMEGPIEDVYDSVPGATKVLTVMGQTVVVEDQATRLQPPLTFADLDSSRIGNVIEISGFRRTDDTIKATFIQKKADDITAFLAGDDLEVEGIVADLDVASPDTFRIAGLTVDYSSATVSGTLADGVLVEVKGNNPVGTTLSADSVEVISLCFPDSDRAEVEGFITSFTPAPCEFVVAGQRVDCSGADFVGGLPAGLAPDIRVEAEGPIRGGVLIAEEVEFEESISIEANAATVDAAAGSLTLEGLPGITVYADQSLTEFDGINGIGEISSGNNLDIRGMRIGGTVSDIIAVRIKLASISPETIVELQGPVDAYTDPPSLTESVTILGVTVDTRSISDSGFEGADDQPIGKAGFFNALSIGDIVKARADRPSLIDPLVWEQIEFEQ